MKNLFRMDSPVMLFLAAVWDLMVMNMLFIICCLPIITIGPALSALLTCTMRMVRKEGNAGGLAFLKAFGANFKQGLLLTLIYLVVGAALALNGWFMLTGGKVYSFGIKCICGLVLLVYLASVSWVFALQSRFDNPVKVTVKNSFIIAVAKPLRTIGIILCTAFPFVLLYFATEFFLKITWFWAMMGFSFIAYVNSISYVSVTEMVIKKKEELEAEAAEKALEEAAEEDAENGTPEALPEDGAEEVPGEEPEEN